MFTFGLFYVVYLQVASPPWVAGIRRVPEFGQKNHPFVDHNPGTRKGGCSRIFILQKKLPSGYD